MSANKETCACRKSIRRYKKIEKKSLRRMSHTHFESLISDTLSLDSQPLGWKSITDLSYDVILFRQFANYMSYPVTGHKDNNKYISTLI